MRIWIGIGLLMLGCGVAGAQVGSPEPQSARPTTIPGLTVNNDSDQARLKKQRDHMIMDERRKKILADTDRLLALATQLKAAVDASTKNELSLEVIRKAAEIEKLAHDVKERMRN